MQDGEGDLEACREQCARDIQLPGDLQPWVQWVHRPHNGVQPGKAGTMKVNSQCNEYIYVQYLYWNACLNLTPKHYN